METVDCGTEAGRGMWFSAPCEHLFCIETPGPPVAQVPFFGPISCGQMSRITYIKHEITPCLKVHLVQIMVCCIYYLFLSRGHRHSKSSKQNIVLCSICHNSKCRILETSKNLKIYPALYPLR